MIAKQLREKRAALIAENRALTEKARAENREMTGEELDQFERRMEDIDRLGKQILLEERQAEAEAEADRPVRRNASPEDPEFRNLGHFIHQIRFAPAEMESRAMSMGTGEEGGFALPEQFRGELLQVSPEEAIVRPRALVIPAGDPPDAKITMPALDQGDKGAFAGVSVTWISEGDAKSETSPALKEVSLEPKEVAAHVVVTDKLLRNWQASSALVSRLLREAITAAEDYAFLRENGIGKPKGVLSADCKLTVNRNTANTVKFVDVASMLGRIYPDSLGSAVWVASITVLPQLIQMEDAGHNTIFIRGDATKGVPSTLFGLPIVFTGRVPTLGNAGDLMLADFKYYIIKDGSGPFVAASPHVHFVNNKTVIKAFWNVDGNAWPAAPLKLEDGATTVSPFVVLQ